MTPTSLVSPPASVFVPVAGPPAEDGSMQVVLRACEGALVLPAYSTLDALLAGCGPAQPWAVLRSDAIAHLLPGWGADLVLLDVALARSDRTGVGAA